jgi:hypothetical protein
VDSATEYLLNASAEMDGGYTFDCVTHACALARLLLDAGRRPWIGRLRDVRSYGEDVFHAPLIPARFTGEHARCWNTHYVCCADGLVYDPIVGAALPAERYTEAVFGRVLPVEEHWSADATADLLERGELRQSFRRTG